MPPASMPDNDSVFDKQLQGHKNQHSAMPKTYHSLLHLKDFK